MFALPTPVSEPPLACLWSVCDLPSARMGRPGNFSFKGRPVYFLYCFFQKGLL